MLIFDAHLDLSMNALEWNRDLTRSIEEMRQREKAMSDKPDRGQGTVCLPEMRRGGIGLCVATQIARIEHNAYSPVFGWRSQEQAWAITQGQLAWYRAMEEAGQMVQIRDAQGLEKHLELWKSEPGRVPRRESQVVPGSTARGSDATAAPAAEHSEQGVYANGTDASGGFNSQGRELLKAMGRLGIILDATHLCDDCFWEALDLFRGPIWASHQNCRALVPHSRQHSDEQIKALIERGAVMGAALDAWMMVAGWTRGKTTPEPVG